MSGGEQALAREVQEAVEYEGRRGPVLPGEPVTVTERKTGDQYRGFFRGYEDGQVCWYSERNGPNAGCWLSMRRPSTILSRRPSTNQQEAHR